MMQQVSPRRSRVLVVDDNPSNVAVVMEALGEEFVLRAAGGGEEALDALDSFNPDVVLLDVMMPGMNGLEVCSRIRESQSRRFTKIVMLSAKTMVRERLQGYEAGADDYLTKPFEPEELLWKIRVFSRLRIMEEIDHLKRQLLASLATGDGGPLESIRVITETLRRGRVRTAKRQRLGSLICRNAARVRSFADAALRYCALRAGKAKLALAHADLGVILREAVGRSADLAKDRKCRILERGEGESFVSCDPQELGGALDCLLATAIRVTRRRGTVIACLRTDGGVPGIEIRTDGPCNSRDFLRRAFDGSFCTDDSWDESDAAGSAGRQLMLAAAREVVLLHGGTLEFHTEEGGGTTFRLRLPAAEETPRDHSGLHAARTTASPA